MLSNLTIQLLFLMLGSALAGLIIGICIYKIRALGHRKRWLQEQQQQLSAKDSDIEALQHERDVVFHALQTQETESLESGTLLRKTESQYEALQVHARLQAQRLQTLQTELQSAEEKNIVLQRDFSNYRLNRTRELQSLHGSNGADSRLPLLNKRAVGRRGSAEQSSGYSSATDRDFPSIAESDLPDSLDLEQAIFGAKGGSKPHG